VLALVNTADAISVSGKQLRTHLKVRQVVMMEVGTEQLVGDRNAQVHLFTASGQSEPVIKDTLSAGSLPSDT
jgi:hypothetical protein